MSEYPRKELPMLARFSMWCGSMLVSTDDCGYRSVATTKWRKNAQSAWRKEGDFIFVAGMQGVDPATNRLVDGDEARVRQAFLNLKLIAQSEGATLQDCVRITIYVSDLRRLRSSVKYRANFGASHRTHHEPCLR